jgi:hypothetical protein
MNLEEKWHDRDKLIRAATESWLEHCTKEDSAYYYEGPEWEGNPEWEHNAIVCLDCFLERLEDYHAEQMETMQKAVDDLSNDLCKHMEKHAAADWEIEKMEKGGE